MNSKPIYSHKGYYQVKEPEEIQLNDLLVLFNIVSKEETIFRVLGAPRNYTENFFGRPVRKVWAVYVSDKDENKLELDLSHCGLVQFFDGYNNPLGYNLNNFLYRKGNLTLDSIKVGF